MSKIQEVKRYKTLDGKTFETKIEAQKHQDYLDAEEDYLDNLLFADLMIWGY